jgi:DNA repair protein RecO (recombination protein O)
MADISVVSYVSDPAGRRTMRRVESTAVVLGTRDVGEADLLVTLLVRDWGRITGVAKAAKKSKRRFVNTFDTSHVIRVRFYRPRGRDLFLIEDASLVDPHPNVFGDVRSAAYGSFVIELVRELTPEEEASADLFDAAASFLALLDERGAREDLLWLFVLRILKVLGLAPLFSSCVRCRKEGWADEGSRFVPEAGGMVCAACLLPRDRGIVLGRGTVAALTKALDIPLERLPRITLGNSSLSETRQALFSFIDHQTPRRLRSADFIERYLRRPAPPPHRRIPERLRVPTGLSPVVYGGSRPSAPFGARRYPLTLRKKALHY